MTSADIMRIVRQELREAMIRIRNIPDFVKVVAATIPIFTVGSVYFGMGYLPSFWDAVKNTLYTFWMARYIFGVGFVLCVAIMLIKVIGAIIRERKEERGNDGL